jgi:hypothetical protein
MSAETAAATVGVGEVTTDAIPGKAEYKRQGEEKRVERNDDRMIEEVEEEQQEKEREEVEGESIEEAVTATAALSALDLGGKKGQEEEEEEEEECLVCLNGMKGNDVDNPANPPLVCGHRYHAFCLHFWVKKCTSKCTDPTCPYCRSPLQEMGGT